MSCPRMKSETGGGTCISQTSLCRVVEEMLKGHGITVRVVLWTLLLATPLYDIVNNPFLV